MLILLIYDIQNNRTRLRLSDGLLERGLLRIQKSVFLGTADVKSIRKLVKRIQAELEPEDRIALFRLPPGVWDRAEIIGTMPDEAWLRGGMTSLII